MPGETGHKADAGPQSGMEAAMDTLEREPTLKELLKGEAEAAPVIETPPEATPPAAAPDAAAAPPTGEADAGAPPAGETEAWTTPAYMAEKRKRQAAEAREKDLEAELEKLRGGSQAAPANAETPDPISDPDGFRQSISWEARVLTSEAIMRSSKTDYDAVSAIYTAAVSKGEAPRIPGNHPAPAQFAYEQGKRLQAFTKYGDDPDAYEKKLEKTLREKWEADTKKADEERRAKLKSQIMPTSAGDRNAAPMDDEGDGSEDEPLSSILKKRNAKRKAARK